MKYYAMLIKRLDFYATMTAHQNKVILNLDGISLRSYCGLARHVLHVQAKKNTKKNTNLYPLSVSWSLSAQ